VRVVLILGTVILALAGCADLEISWREAKSDFEELFGPQSEGTSAEEQAQARAAYQHASRQRAVGDQAKAAESLREAAELGHGAAAYELGIAYLGGRGVPKDLEKSATWINRAADLGNAGAQFLVGSSLYAGVGVPQDIPRGLMFLERGADQGHPKAQYLLGQAYVDGAGVTRNAAWAARWYGKAGRSGHVQAQYSYGVMLASGLGLPKDSRRAYEWLSLAGKNGDERAAELARKVSRGLTPEQRAAADASVLRFSARRSAGYADPPTVMYVQQRLNAIGYDTGPVDGIAGPRTRAAIEAYQAAQRLTVDGQSSRELVESLHNGDGT
jgi:localization factor PodJL